MTSQIIHPIHPSLRGMLAQGLRVKPKDMERLVLTKEQNETLHRVSMEIFCDCTNVGVPFQESIAAVYLSGLQHGQALGGRLASAE